MVVWYGLVWSGLVRYGNYSELLGFGQGVFSGIANLARNRELLEIPRNDWELLGITRNDRELLVTDPPSLHVLCMLYTMPCCAMSCCLTHPTFGTLPWAGC